MSVRPVEGMWRGCQGDVTRGRMSATKALKRHSPKPEPSKVAHGEGRGWEVEPLCRAGDGLSVTRGAGLLAGWMACWLAGFPSCWLAGWLSVTMAC